MNKIILFILISLMPHSVFSQVQLHWEKVLNRQTIAIAVNPLDDHKIYTASGNDFLVSDDAGLTWQSRNTNIPDDCHNIAVSPFDTSLIIIYADGNLLRSADGGFNWDIVLTGVSMNGETIDFHPMEADSVFYVDFGTGTLWVSPDRGQSWLKRKVIAGLTAVCSFKINPHNPRQMLAGAANSNVMISTDAGFNWKQVKAPTEGFTEVPKIVWDPLNPDWAYGSVFGDPQNSFIRVADEGNDWSYDGLKFVDSWALDIDPVNGNIYLGTFSEDTYPGHFKSYDSGKSWQRLGDKAVNGNWQLKTGSDSLVYTASVEFPAGIYRLKIDQPLGYVTGVVKDSVSGNIVDYFEIDVPASGDKMIASNSNALYKLALPPGTYSIKYAYGPVNKIINDIVVEAGKTDTADVRLHLNIRHLTLAGTIRGTLGEPVKSLVTLNYTKATTEKVSSSILTDNNGYFRFDSLSSLNQFNKLTIEPLLFPYIGIETTAINIDTLQDFSLDYADVIIANDSNNQENSDLYIRALQKNDLAGIATSSVTDPQNLAPNIIALSRKNTLIWVSNNSLPQSAALDKMQLLADAGSHIIISGQNLLENNANLISETQPFFHPFFSNLGIRFNGNYSIEGFADPMRGFYSNPIGRALSLTIRLTNQESPDIIFYDNDNIHKTFYYGDTAGDTLNIAGINVDNTGHNGKALILGFDLHFQSPTLLEEILKRSIDYFDGVINSVGKAFIPGLKGFQLYPNYPNPFNPLTKIKYSVRAHGNAPQMIILSVYNILGQKVTTLVNKKQSGGHYEVLFDAAHLTSGVYYYTLQAAGYKQTRKMVLIR